jgi:TrbB protein
MDNTPSTFAADFKNNLLTVTHLADGKLRTLCLIELVRPLTLVIEGQTLVCRSRHYQVTIKAPEGTEPGDLLSCVASALAAARKLRRFKAFTAVAVLIMACGIVITQGFTKIVPQTDLATPSVEPANTSALAARPPQVSAAPEAAEGMLSAPASVQVAPPPADGWLLPVSARSMLPVNLRNAAERKLFSVDYSTGHDRTLYVFADPECPNCQRLEPALNAAAANFNVVIFPVAVIGQDKSIASITPVLCLPPEQRKAAWSTLFDVGHGVLDLGKPASTAQDVAGPAGAPAGECNFANKALGVNEVAYKTYRIPGTPWVIADDGRHVPQDVLQDASKLQAFIGEAEVSYGDQ